MAAYGPRAPRGRGAGGSAESAVALTGSTCQWPRGPRRMGPGRYSAYKGKQKLPVSCRTVLRRSSESAPASRPGPSTALNRSELEAAAGLASTPWHLVP
jgi:hypothetical protein